ncbi:AraC family transcriptional regulator [Oenococcus sicerae]|uniref:AraC family transcriptional regulator n=1 Tax=Oenococcus sicerae TaxID=2203724 RepID=A0ABX5QKL6_9LACO|nr:AraC family transcriptional regulator [Oenococcus sicerae]QAS69341.1 AraC family transcriptional regulator [Oenococcus sicerae]
MARKYTFINENFNEYLYLSSGGFEHCEPSHSYGPGARTGYMIHYVSEGKGVFTSKNIRYHISPGEFFFIQPGKIVKMEANQKEPWTINWIRFKGRLVDTYLNQIGVSLMNPVVSGESAQKIKKIISDLIQTSLMNQADDLYYSEKLLEVIRIMRLAYPSTVSSHYSADAKIFHEGMQFIEKNFDSPITIEDVRTKLAVDRSYLYRAFKKWLDASPKEFLVSLRMDKAKEILQDKNNQNTIRSIAFACGFEDPQYFTKAFKDFTGKTPTEYRNE